MVLVGEPGFEPGASSSQTMRATGLRHSPISIFYQFLLFTVLPTLVSQSRRAAELRHSPTHNKTPSGGAPHYRDARHHRSKGYDTGPLTRRST
jgi:hypothetical protein